MIGDGLYLSEIVGAAMKKQVSYNYKIKLEKQSGGPVNSKCECPAGKGPHATCKHIAAVLLMAQCFSEKGDILVEKTCTQGLQTFHQPRSYYRGAPVKIENLPFKRKAVNDNLDDPKPGKWRDIQILCVILW